ncbi:hypothetical protein HanIR_Chr02g0089451 [Helianthus annuus]|nr:hypothetical protein HanIR_Chr02g0089451 [Helianthus annuus]
MWKKGERQFSLLYREILAPTQSGMMRLSEQNMGDALLMFPFRVVKQTEVRNRVELFKHLPQYELKTKLPRLEMNFYGLNSVHPAVYKVLQAFLDA